MAKRGHNSKERRKERRKGMVDDRIRKRRVERKQTKGERETIISI